MASFATDIALQKLAKGEINLGTADLRVLLVMTNTTCDTEFDKTTLSGYTALDEFNGTGYTRADLTMSAVAIDGSGHIAWADAADFTFGSLTGGSRQIQGELLYLYVDGTNAHDIPLGFIDTGGFPFSASGSPVNDTVAALGLAQVARG
jgi:hypothetical protein